MIGFDRGAAGAGQGDAGQVEGDVAALGQHDGALRGRDMARRRGALRDEDEDDDGRDGRDRAEAQRPGQQARAAGRAARVRVVEDGEASRQLRVEIVASDGAVLLVRELGGEGSCEERAEAAAVVVAAWLAQDAIASSMATASPASPSSSTSSSSSPSIAASSSSSPARWEIAAAAGVVAGTAPALRVETLWAPWRGRAMLRASLLLEGTRESELAGGQARWLRGDAAMCRRPAPRMM